METYKVQDIANFFLRAIDRNSGSSITPLKLQKLLYFAQGHYLAKYDKPLFEEDFEAWVHGPVIPEIYQKYKEFTFENIPEPENYFENAPDFNEEIMNFMAFILEKYSIYDGKYLEKMTHQEEPWKNNFDEFEQYHKNIISKEEIKKYYREKKSCAC